MSFFGVAAPPDLAGPWSSLQKAIYPALTDNPDSPLILICGGSISPATSRAAS
jgi:hypothetical protein